jgi:hypothetical protein
MDKVQLRKSELPTEMGQMKQFQPAQTEKTLFLAAYGEHQQKSLQREWR